MRCFKILIKGTSARESQVATFSSIQHIKDLVNINFRFKHAPPSSQDHSRFLLHISLPQDQPSLVNQGKQALPV